MRTASTIARKSDHAYLLESGSGSGSLLLRAFELEQEEQEFEVYDNEPTGGTVTQYA